MSMPIATALLTCTPEVTAPGKLESPRVAPADASTDMAGQTDTTGDPEWKSCLWRIDRPFNGATGAASSFRAFTVPDGECVKKCPFEATAIPACPQRTAGCPWRVAERYQAQLVGKRIVVVGSLGASYDQPVVLRMCPCCTREKPALHVGSLALEDSSAPDAFRCYGDQTTLCCGFAQPLVVVAVGQLRQRQVTRAVGAAATIATLFEPTLCALTKAGALTGEADE